MKTKQYLPYLIAMLVFISATVAHFNPLFTGKEIDQYDIKQFNGMSKEINDFRERHNQEPLWTNSMFGGMPAYQISTLYPGNFLQHVDLFLQAFLPYPAGLLLLIFTGFFILLLCLGVNPWLAIAGSLAYGLSTYFFVILGVGHNSKAHAIAYLAPFIGGAILLMKRKYLTGFALTTLAFALELNANHLQITYYGLIFIIILMIGYLVTAIREKTLRQYFAGGSLLAAAMVIAVLPNAGNIMCTYEYSQYSTRGSSDITIDKTGKPNPENRTNGLNKDYAVQYSQGISETFTLLVPDFKGGSAEKRLSDQKSSLKSIPADKRAAIGNFWSYYGPQDYSAGPYYPGAVVFFIFFLGLIILKHPLKWPLLIVTLISLLLSYGKNMMFLSSLFLDYFPMYNKFRAVSMITILAQITIPLIAILTVDQLIRKDGNLASVRLPFRAKPVNMKNLLAIALLVVGGFLAINLMVPGLFNTFTKENERALVVKSYTDAGYTERQYEPAVKETLANVATVRKSIFRSDVFRSLIFVTIAGALIFLLLIRKLKAGVFLVMLTLIILVDLWPVAFRYLNSKNFVSKSKYDLREKTKADIMILQDTTPGKRVVTLAANPFQDAKVSWFHHSIGGYHGAKLKKYQEFIDFHLTAQVNDVSTNIVKVYQSDSLYRDLLGKQFGFNMLNCKYLIVPTTIPDQPVAMLNPAANGAAWFVKRIEIKSDANEELLGLKDIDSKSVCLAQKKNIDGVTSELEFPGEGEIKLISWQPNQIIYHTDTKDKEFAIFSEIYYPAGWSATIDGKPAEYGCVNYLLRGMEIPAGQHVVEFKFAPETYYTGNKIAAFGSVATLLVFIGGLALGIYRKELVFPSPPSVKK